MTNAEKRKRLEELKILIYEKKKEKDYAKAMQLALKLTLNGTYGAFANKYFVCSNADIANAITIHGRDILQYMIEKIEDYLYNKWHLDKNAHAKLGKEYLGICNDKYAFYNTDFKKLGHEYNNIDDLLRHKHIELSDLTINEFEHENIKILYQYNIWDFSNVKPIDENPTWGTIEDSVKKDRPKYIGDYQSIIYGDTDSNYLSLTPLMNSVGFNPNQDDYVVKNFILHVDENHIKPLFNKFLSEYADDFYVKNIHDFELETISKSALFIAKKHYLNNIVWEDGVHHDSLTYFFPKGIDIIKSSTPPFVRRNIYRVINYLFSNPNSINITEVMKILRDIKKEFQLADIEDISQTTSCSNYNRQVIDDTTGVHCKPSTHFGVKAACFHNYLLNKNSEYKTKYDMIKSGKIKHYYCKHPLNDVFAYQRNFHPIEIVTKERVVPDFDEQFEKTFLGIVNSFIEPLGFPTITKRLSVLTSLFGT